MEKLRHFDTFSGYGGFTISAQKLGWETVGFSEVDKYANAVLEYNFNIKNYGDITKIKGEDLPDVDIITGGSPCQDLSVAGKGAGLNGARSGLFFCFINLIKEKQPMYFVWENVKGALSSSRGWDFARVQIEMEQAGYDVWWQLINAKDFGVPQNRERIFAIGIRKGSGREVLFEQRESRQNPNKIVNTQIAVPVLTPDRENKRQNGRRFKTDGEPSFTITGQDRHGVFNGMRIRRLTPTECERLMGLQDGWTAKGIIDGKEVDISDTQRYKMCGNGVVVNCVDYIYKLLRQ